MSNYILKFYALLLENNTSEILEENFSIEKYLPEKEYSRNAEYLDGIALLQSLSDKKSFCQQLPIPQSSLLTLLCGIIIEKKKKHYFKFQCIYIDRKYKFEDFKWQLKKTTQHQLKCVTLKDYRLVGFLGV